MTNTHEKAAVDRIVAKRRLEREVFLYAAVNGLFVLLWALGDRGFFWPGIFMVGWGLHLAICLLGFRRRPITSAQIEKELERMTARTEPAR